MGGQEYFSSGSQVPDSESEYSVQSPLPYLYSLFGHLMRHSLLKPVRRLSTHASSPTNVSVSNQIYKI